MESSDSRSSLFSKLEEICNNELPSAPPRPIMLPKFNPSQDVGARLSAVQKYISSFAYNHLRTLFSDSTKHIPQHSLSTTARQIIDRALPIKCMEAVILAIYITNDIPGLVRLPVSMTSRDGVGTLHRHIILAIRYNDKYGSLGLSRRKELYYRDLKFDCFSDLLLSFKEAYSDLAHTLVKFKIGLHIPNDAGSAQKIKWRYKTVRVSNDWDTECKPILDEYPVVAKRAWEIYLNYGQFPDVDLLEEALKSKTLRSHGIMALLPGKSKQIGKDRVSDYDFSQPEFLNSPNPRKAQGGFDSNL